ncbi:MAG TPA: hypothetical protein VL405_04120 [Sphingomonas sp.]|nr:hypothetical protein [Sphingomonas sp.]
MKAAVPIAALALAGTALIAADAPPPARPYAALQACRGIVDNAQRLACYDQAAAALDAAQKSEEVVIVDRQEVKKARKGLFGFNLPRIGFLAGRQGNAEDQQDEQELNDTVGSARALPYGKWRIVLSTGAVWETTEADSRFTDPRPGMTVNLTKGAMGNFFLKVAKGRAVSARRVG